MYTGSDAELKQFQRPIFWPTFVFSWLVTFLISLFTLTGWIFLASPVIAWAIATYRASVKAPEVLAMTLKVQEKLLAKALGDSGNRPGYFCVDYTYMPSAIAVDVVKGTLTAVTWSGPTNKERLKALPDDCLRSVTYERAELTKWSAYQPGATTLEPVGSLAGLNASEMMAMQRKNAKARVEQQQNTGLTISSNRLHEQEIFVNLKYEAAKQWILLIEKFTAGTLPAVDTSTEFPKTQA
ncbi:MAG: hypothetical protein Q7K57_44890 [Burkholderiaceae bacterium]|nr:hypothetical protein [Burkholderiaceae bacterium]